MARKQLQIAGTEKEANEEIEVAAAAYRNLMLDRVDFGKREAAAKAELIAVVHRQVDEGKLKLPEGTGDGEVVTVYRFEGEDGEELEVKYGRKEQVRVRAAKVGGDDETELME